MIQATKTEAVPAETTSAHPGWWTALAVLATSWLGVPFILPIVAALPWLVFQRRNAELRSHPTPLIRWAVAVWATGAAMAALAGERVARAIPWGVSSSDATRAWLEGSGGATPSWPTMIAWLLVFVIASASLRGVLAPIIVAHALLITAVQAAVVFAQSSNILAAGIVALPLWSGLLLCGMLLLLDPLAIWGASRPWRVRDTTLGSPASRRRLQVGVGLVVAAFLARLLLAGPVTDVLRRLTLQ